eukprot:g1542.t1
MSSSPIKVLIYECPGSFRYGKFFENLFSNAARRHIERLKGKTSITSVPSLSFQTVVCDGNKESFETEKKDVLPKIDHVIVTGSRFAAYADVPWIKKLICHIRDDILKANRIPVCGICFGHQILAQALGGKVIRNPKGYESGISKWNIEDDAARYLDELVQEIDATPLFSVTSDQTSQSTAVDECNANNQSSQKPFPSSQQRVVKLLCWHGDVVTTIPSHLRDGGSNAFGNQMMYSDSKSATAYAAYGAPILSFQSHPEFEEATVQKLSEIRRKAMIEEKERSKKLSSEDLQLIDEIHDDTLSDMKKVTVDSIFIRDTMYAWLLRTVKERRQKKM